MRRATWIVAAVFVSIAIGGLVAFFPGSGGDPGGTPGDKARSKSATRRSAPAEAVSGTFFGKHDITDRNSGTVSHVWGETRATFSLEPAADGSLRGTAAVTASFKLESTGNDPCPRYHTELVTESWTVHLTGEVVQGRLFISGDPNGMPERKVPVIGCTSPDSVLAMWMPFDLWRAMIAFSDGRFDLREDFPLRAGETGEMFQEIHIRQPRH